MGVRITNTGLRFLNGSVTGWQMFIIQAMIKILDTQVQVLNCKKLCDRSDHMNTGAEFRCHPSNHVTRQNKHYKLKSPVFRYKSKCGATVCCMLLTLSLSLKRTNGQD